jgi:CBS domain-containing protein
MSKLETIQAKDLMQKDVVRFEASASISEAVTVFEDLHISGAPVVDGLGQVVGVLSASDIVRPERVRVGTGVRRENEPAVRSWDDEGANGEDEIQSMDEYGEEALPSDTVTDWMTRSIVSVAPETSLRDVCRLMVQNNVHRVLVIDKKRLAGILSTFDVVRCVAERT